MSCKYLIIFLLCFFTFTKALNAQEEEFYRQLNPITYDSDHVKKIDTKELECVKRVLWFEARNQSDKGIKSVLSVVLNRKQHDLYPKTFCKIEQQAKQFSYIKGKKIPKINPDEDKSKYLKISDLAYKAVSNDFKSILPRNVLHYTRYDVKVQWLKDMKLFSKVGDHNFYMTKKGNS